MKQRPLLQPGDAVSIASSVAVTCPPEVDVLPPASLRAGYAFEVSIQESTIPAEDDAMPSSRPSLAAIGGQTGYGFDS